MTRAEFYRQIWRECHPGVTDPDRDWAIADTVVPECMTADITPDMQKLLRPLAIKAIKQAEAMSDKECREFIQAHLSKN